MKAALKYSRSKSAVKGEAGPMLKKNSVFYRGHLTRNDPLEDLLPPERYRHSEGENDKYRWRDLSEIQKSSLGGVTEELGWHDCVTLIMRLRRFSDLRVFMDQMNGEVNRRGFGSVSLVSSSYARGSQGMEYREKDPGERTVSTFCM